MPLTSLAINILGILVFLAAGWLFSHDRRKIHWQSVGILELNQIGRASCRERV